MLTRASLCTLVLALVLTTVTVVVHWGLAPATGLVRSFYPTADFQSAPATLERTTDVSLAFVTRNPSLPRRSFGVQWRGFWYLPEPRVIELLVATNDDILLQLDSATVIRRSARSGPQTVRRSVTLTKGVHEIVIRYRQHGSGMGLIVAGSLDGGRVRDLSAASVFAEPVGRFDVVMASAVPWLMTMAGVMWLASVGLAIASRFVGGGPDQQSITRAVFINRLRLIAAPALVGPVVLFVVGPLAIHTANQDEFVVAFTGILWPWVIGAVILSWTVLLVTGAVASLISERLTRLFAAVLLAAGLLLWVQGTFMVADYGPLYGEGLDLRAQAGRVPYELALWAAVLLLAVVYARPVSGVAPWLSLLFVGLQVVAAVLTVMFTRDARGPGENSWSTPPTSMYSLSRSNNVVHIVLDAYVSEMFGEAASQDPSYFNRTFSGFIFFADHLGAFPTTRASMPAMLTGETYRNAEPFQQFLDRTFLRRSIASALAAHGFAVRSITFHAEEHPTAVSSRGSVTRYRIPTPYGTYQDYLRFTALQLFDLAALRHAPQVLKASVYNNDQWLWQRILASGSLETRRSRTARASNHAAFLTELTERLKVGVDGPVYQFIHVAIPHPPIVLDAECSFVEGGGTSRTDYTGQARCAVGLVGRLLDRLRALGVYDESVIVLTSDHGWRVPRRHHPLAGVATPAGDLQSVALTAMPLLVVKPRGSAGPLRTSTAPTSIADVAATIADLAGLPPGLFPGQSALKIEEGARRPRSFAFHSWRNADWQREYMDSLHVFAVDGPIRDPASWRFRETIVDPASKDRFDR
jgi:Sulfatase